MTEPNSFPSAMGGPIIEALVQAITANAQLLSELAQCFLYF